MNSLEPVDYKKKQIPFYAWQCVTLQLETRDVDLVVQSEKDMDALLMILIHATKTVDGNKGSLAAVEKFVLTQKARMNKKKGKLEQAEVTDQDKTCIFYSTLMKFRLMRIRSKISFMAFEKNVTIPELLLTTIKNSYVQLV